MALIKLTRRTEDFKAKISGFAYKAL